MFWGMIPGHLSDDSYAQIGMMLDEAGLYDRLSCIDNLDIYRRLYQLPYNVIEPALRRDLCMTADRKQSLSCPRVEAAAFLCQSIAS